MSRRRRRRRVLTTAAAPTTTAVVAISGEAEKHRVVFGAVLLRLAADQNAVRNAIDWLEENIMKAAQNFIDWLGENQTAEKTEIESKGEKLNSIICSIMAKAAVASPEAPREEEREEEDEEGGKRRRRTRKRRRRGPYPLHLPRTAFQPPWGRRRAPGGRR